MAVKIEFKNLPSERPPPTDIPINPKNSYMTALANFCTANGKKLCVESGSEGDAHMPQWTSVCFIDNKEYGKACAFTKRSADKEAAYQSIKMLEAEGTALPATRNYHPIFMDYVAEQNLEQRIKFDSSPHGPEHKRTWRCVVSLDGIEIAGGSGPTKKTATEEASINAATFWP